MRRTVVLVSTFALACSREPSSNTARDESKPLSRAPGTNWQSPSPPASPPGAINESAVVSPSPSPAAAEAASLAVAVYKRSAEGTMARVDASTPFKSGDGVRFGVTVPRKGHLYLLLKGSSGRTELMYPTKKIGGGANTIAPGAEVILPQDGWFVFDKNAGVETVYALFSVEDDPGLFSNIESATGFGGQPANQSLEAEVLAQLQSRARTLPAGAPPPPTTLPASASPSAMAVPATGSAPAPAIVPVTVPAAPAGAVVVLRLTHQ